MVESCTALICGLCRKESRGEAVRRWRRGRRKVRSAAGKGGHEVSGVGKARHEPPICARLRARVRPRNTGEIGCNGGIMGEQFFVVPQNQRSTSLKADFGQPPTLFRVTCPQGRGGSSPLSGTASTPLGRSTWRVFFFARAERTILNESARNLEVQIFPWALIGLFSVLAALKADPSITSISA